MAENEWDGAEKNMSLFLVFSGILIAFLNLTGDEDIKTEKGLNCSHSQGVFSL